MHSSIFNIQNVSCEIWGRNVTFRITKVEKVIGSSYFTIKYRLITHKTLLMASQKRDIIMITGDFNAKVGEGVQNEDETMAVGPHDLGIRNERGSTLVLLTSA